MTDNLIRKLLNDCQAKGYSFACSYDGEVDYKGPHPAEAEEALKACDEMTLSIRDGDKRIATILIVNSNEGAEVFADWSGKFMDDWSRENLL